MIVSKKVILRLKGHSSCRMRLAKELNTHYSTIDRWIRENEEDGPLTRAKAIEILSEETGVSLDKIISK